MNVNTSMLGGKHMTTLGLLILLVLFLGIGNVIGIINLLWLLISFFLIAFGVLAIVGMLYDKDKSENRSVVITSIFLILLGIALLRLFFL